MIESLHSSSNAELGLVAWAGRCPVREILRRVATELSGRVVFRAGYDDELHTGSKQAAICF